MAYRRKPAEHAFKTAAKNIKEGSLPSLLLLYGREQYLVDLTIRMIVNRYVNPATKLLDLTTFTSETVSPDALRDACETLSMFSERRVVVVRDFALLSGGKIKGFSEEDEAALAAYIKKLPDDVILIFTCNSPDKKRKLYKACASAGSAFDFDTLSEPDLINFVRKQFRSAGKTCRDGVIRELISNSGYYNKETDYTLYNLVNDIGKIISYAERDDITESDVLAVISGSLETYIFALIDSVSSGRRGDALRLLYNILGSGEDAYRVLAMIVSQYEFLLEVKELREQGLRKEEITEELSAHEFRVMKALGFTDRYTTDALRRFLIAAYDVDRKVKSGFMEQNLALELLIASA